MQRESNRVGEIEEERNIENRDKTRKETNLLRKKTHESHIAGHLSLIECNNVYFYGVNLRDSLIVSILQPLLTQNTHTNTHTHQNTFTREKVLDVKRQRKQSAKCNDTNQ